MPASTRRILAIAKEVLPWGLSVAATVAIFLMFSAEQMAALLSAADVKEAIKAAPFLSASPVLFAFFLLFGAALRSLLSESRRAVLWAFFTGAVLGFFNTLGNYVSAFGGIEPVFGGRWRLLYAVFFTAEWTGACVCFAAVCLWLWRFARSRKPMLPPGDLRPVRLFFSYFALLLAGWAIWMWFYGVAVAFDTRMQIPQGLFLQPLDDHHPVLMSLAMGRVIAFGKWLFGSYYAGVCLFGAVQMVFMAAVLAFALTRLRAWGIGRLCAGLAAVFYLLHPFFATYSFSPLKDVWLSCLVLVCVVAALDCALGFSDSALSWKRATAWFALFLCVLFAKKTGFAILAFTFPFLMAIFWRGRWRFLAAYAVAFAVFAVVQGPVFSHFGVKKGGSQEALSTPLQQIARTLKLYPGSLSPAQRAVLSEILPVEVLGEVYDPIISDSVKALLNRDALWSDPGKYAGLWARIGARHPLTYVDATLNNTLGYWYANVFYGGVMRETYFEVSRRFVDEGRFSFDEDAVSRPPVEQTFLMRHLYQLVYATKLVPLVSLLTSIGFFFSAILFGAYLEVVLRDYRVLRFTPSRLPSGECA